MLEQHNYINVQTHISNWPEKRPESKANAKEIRYANIDSAHSPGKMPKP